LGFRKKPREIAWARVPPGKNHLEGDEPIQANLPSLIDDAHSPASDHLENLKARHRRQPAPLSRKVRCLDVLRLAYEIRFERRLDLELHGEFVHEVREPAAV